MDKSHVMFLALLDVFSTFSMIDHTIILRRLETSLGLNEAHFLWSLFLLTCSSQMVIQDDAHFQWVPIKCGVPQGSMLDPLL